MIGRLNGKLIEKHPPVIVIECHGVGYEVEAPMSTIYELPEIGENLEFTLICLFVTMPIFCMDSRRNLKENFLGHF